MGDDFTECEVSLVSLVFELDHYETPSFIATLAAKRPRAMERRSTLIGADLIPSKVTGLPVVRDSDQEVVQTLVCK